MSRRKVVLRGFGVLLALAVGAAGAWLLVTSNHVRWVRIGALAELWAVLLGAFALFGSRRRHEPLVVPAEPVVVDEADAAPEPTAGDESVAVDADEVAYDKRMEDILRREIRSVLTRELTVVRAQVAALRSDVLERVTPATAPDVAADLQLVGRRLAALSHHEIRPAGEPIGVEFPDPVEADAEPEFEPEVQPDVEPADDADEADEFNAADESGGVLEPTVESADHPEPPDVPKLPDLPEPPDLPEAPNLPEPPETTARPEAADRTADVRAPLVPPRRSLFGRRPRR